MAIYAIIIYHCLKGWIRGGISPLYKQDLREYCLKGGGVDPSLEGKGGGVVPALDREKSEIIVLLCLWWNYLHLNI